MPLLGGRGYGVAVNGFSRDPETGETHLWVATRAADKATWPGMLDTLAAGAMSAGGSALEAARLNAAAMVVVAGGKVSAAMIAGGT